MGGFLTGVDPGIRKTKTPTVNTFVAGVGFTAGSSTTIALTDAPGTEEHLTIFFDGVGQHRSTYSLSGSTVTFDTAIPTGVAEVEATYAPAVYAQLSTVADDAVTTAKIADDAVTAAKIADAVALGGGLIEAPTIFTASGTYTKNASASRIVVWVIGGGGGGAGVATSGNYATGGGGGGGGTAIETIENSAVGSTETVTVGAAGAQGADGDNDGSAGGTSSFGSHCSATGGAGGISYSTGGGSGVDGGVGSGGDLNISGGDGEGSVDSNAGASVSSGGGGGSWLGGRSRGMRAQDTHSDGNPGNPYGGGGGGAQDHGNEAHHGGVGSIGIVIVWEYA